MPTDWIRIEIERPATGYEDVCPELVAEDAMRHVVAHGWNWRLSEQQNVDVPPEADREKTPSKVDKK